MHKSFGNIETSKLYLTLTIQRYNYKTQCFFGPTYHGTKYGILITSPWFVILGHIR